jgi:hypothetical protein
VFAALSSGVILQRDGIPRYEEGRKTFVLKLLVSLFGFTPREYRGESKDCGLATVEVCNGESIAPVRSEWPVSAWEIFCGFGGIC